MRIKKYLPFIYFILGFGLFMFTRYCKFLPNIQLMILIAPIFILKFSRTIPKGKAVLFTLAGFILSFNIALWGLFEFNNNSLSTYFNLIRSSMLAIFWSVPFIVDRFLYPKFKDHRIWSTLTFPIVITALFFILTLEGPFDDGSGTTSSFGYIYESLAFMQIRSVFGIWILIFIHSWLNAIVNHFWEHNFKWKKINRLAIIYSSMLLAIFLFGFGKMYINSSKEVEKVKIAAAVLFPEDGKPVLMSNYFDSKTSSPYTKTVQRVNQMVAAACANGVKIVSFQEFTILIDESDKQKLIAELSQIAKIHQIYLSVTYAYYARQGKGENIHLLFDPSGVLQLEYAKRYLLGLGKFGESGVFRKGEEIIQYLDTPYGRIGLSICRDAGFARYMRQAAKVNVDIMLSPSYDWPKSYSAGYLSAPVENGFSFVRPTYNGYTYAADYHGNILNYMESDKTDTGIMYADIPVKGIRTVYRVIGDLTGWLCVIAMVGLIGLVVFKKAPVYTDKKNPQ